MAIISFPQGLGESLGDVLVTCEPLLFNGDIWYVHHSGDDTYDGRSRERPFATVLQAVTDSAAGDLIVCLDGHTETFTQRLYLNGRFLVGAGLDSAGRPTVKLYQNSGSRYFFQVSAGTNTLIGNLWLSGSGGKVLVTGGTLVTMRNCYIECDDEDAISAVILGSAGESAALVRILDTTFVSIATSVDGRPLGAIVSSGTGPDIIILRNVTIDNGTYGWQERFPIQLLGGTAVLNAEGLTMLNGADMKVEEATIGFINVQTGDGHTRIEWVDVGE